MRQVQFHVPQPSSGRRHRSRLTSGRALLTESLPAGRLFDEFADMVDEFGAYCDFYHEGRKIDRVTAA
ncbi:hypothetical protein ACFXO9_36650 [Nocardia tengchongensis]|uniref:hypothetical protein n=1 Tax=Nocardia tengchongensis TaxID=2055889 RepID=UPI00368E4383